MEKNQPVVGLILLHESVKFGAGLFWFFLGGGGFLMLTSTAFIDQ